MNFERLNDILEDYRACKFLRHTLPDMSVRINNKDLFLAQSFVI